MMLGIQCHFSVRFHQSKDRGNIYEDQVTQSSDAQSGGRASYPSKSG